MELIYSLKKLFVKTFVRGIDDYMSKNVPTKNSKPQNNAVIKIGDDGQFSGLILYDDFYPRAVHLTEDRTYFLYRNSKKFPFPTPESRRKEFLYFIEPQPYEWVANNRGL